MKDLILLLFSNWQGIVAAALAALGALSACLSAFYALALLIPGDQPDKVIKALLDFTLKYSKKPEPPAS